MRRTRITHKGYRKLTDGLPICTITIELAKQKPWIFRPRTNISDPGLRVTLLDLLPVLVKDLTHPDAFVRYKSAVLLGKVGTEAQSAIPALTTALEDGDENVRAAAAGAIGALASWKRSEYAMKTNSSVDDTHDDMEAVGPTVLSAVPTLIKAMEDDSDRVRLTVVHTLQNISPKDPAASSAIAGRLRHQDERVARAAAMTLSSLRTADPATLELIVDALRDDRPEVRVGAVYVLGKFGKAAEAARPALLRRLRDEPRPEIRLRIQHAVEKIRPET